MKKVGLVVQTHNDDNAIVRITRETACGGACNNCSGCQSTQIDVEAINFVGAKVGQKVIIEMDESKLIFAVFLVYGLPIVMLFIGLAFGLLIIKSEVAAGIIGVLFLISSFALMKKIDEKLKRTDKYKIKIQHIIN